MTLYHELNWLESPCAAVNLGVAQRAEAHQNTLTKPPGSLGRLEEIALQFAAWQGNDKPSINNIAIRVFAGDHGLCQQNISAFPQSVTAQMIDNFVNGGAAINVLSRFANASFDLINLGTATPPQCLDERKNYSLGPGTADCSTQAAMTEQQLIAAINAGRDIVDELPACELFIAGEMGIGNTSSASLLYALLLRENVAALAGPGTGLYDTALQHKKLVLTLVQQKHQETVNQSQSPALTALQLCGGFEIAAISGAYLRAAQKGIPILVDGFITTAAWYLAWLVQPELKHWSLFAHNSGEPAHQYILQRLNVQALLDLQMRLGEGSGAALAIPLLQQALALHNEMATFKGAGVDDSL